jgi:hypothetical protein
MGMKIDPDSLPSRVSVRSDLRPAIAEYMERNFLTDPTEAYNSLVLRGLDQERADKPQTTPVAAQG